MLDVLTWAGYDYTNCETDFRFYWLQQKIAELGSIKGSIKIVLIPALQMNELSKQLANDLNELLDAESEVFVDGFLFYHNEMQYIPGVTPLVGWLKPAMISDQFGFTPHEVILTFKPFLFI